MSIYANPGTRPSLDPSLYRLQDDELYFFQLTTGIQDEQDLKSHILAVQAKAYQIYGYPCIRLFAFVKIRIARLPGYLEALKLLEQRKDPILLDIGCCFGNDVRKAVVDGWPVENVIASDLRQGFWDARHELFNSTSESFPAAFITGDIFDSSMLDISDAQVQARDSSSNIREPHPIRPLKSLTSLTTLKRQVSAIHASALFHLFQESQQRELAQRLAALLLPEKGSIIFGQHGARPEKGFRIEYIRTDDKTAEISEQAMFCHSPESWAKLWEEDIFGPGEANVKVKVETELKQVERWDWANVEEKFYAMNWSVQVL